MSESTIEQQTVSLPAEYLPIADMCFLGNFTLQHADHTYTVRQLEIALADGDIYGQPYPVVTQRTFGLFEKGPLYNSGETRVVVRPFHGSVDIAAIQPAFENLLHRKA